MNHERMQLTRRHRSGDACECDQCRGRLKVVNTEVRLDLDVRIRYLACNDCGWRPEDNKQIVPLEFAPPESS